jgi:hypothetical protein
MRRITLIALALLFSVRAAYAWLDATEKQCEARYGKPQPADTATLGSEKTISYWKDDVHVTADFVKGKCLRISYVYRDPVTQGQIDTFFKANGGATAWAHFKGGGEGEYVRQDGLAKANVMMGYGGGILFSYLRWDKLHEQAVKDAENAKQTAEKERLKKFSHDF